MTITHSINNIINESSELINYLSNADIYKIINDSKFDNTQYISYTTFIFCIMFCISFLYLSDGIYTHWKNTFKKTNKYDTKKYNNIIFLFLYETLKYLSQIPNLITLFIGIIQAIYVSKFINIIVTIMCWLFSLSNEFIKYNKSKKSDETINSNIITLLNKKQVRSDDLYLNDNFILNYENKTPAFIKITDIKYNGETKNLTKNQIDDYDIGFYDNKESTGEDISCQFSIGDIIPPHRIITRPNINITGKLVKYVEPISHEQFKYQTTTPTFLNNVRFFIDSYAIILLFIISLCVSASATVNKYNLKDILKHFFACVIAGNVIIPSMRMTLLYNVYNLLLSLSFFTIKVNSYDSFEKLENIKSVIFDKTGTITEEHLEVHQHYIFDLNSVFQKLKFLNWSNDEIAFAITIANSESNIHEKISHIWGTSPEENKILKYWHQEKKVKLIFNPVKLNFFGEIIFQFPNHPERKILIKNRLPYNFEVGKLCTVTFYYEKDSIQKNIDLIIRQHGTSRFIDKYKNTKKSSSDLLQSLQSNNDNCDMSLEWANNITKNDKRRSMAIAIAISNNDNDNNNDNDLWELFSIYTFENPLRTNVNDVMNFFREKHIPCSILTGDGRETAEDIAKSAGFPDKIYNILFEKDIINCIEIAKNHKITISIEANNLSNILNNTENLAESLLNNPNIFKIIYKASKNIKEQVVVNTQHCLYVGDAKNDELAIKNAYVGVCLSHGAETCRLYASLCIKQPLDLIDLLTNNGYKDMLLIGGQKIFKDVCFIGGLICGCLIVGIHLNHFEFINETVLYKDVWNPIPMLMISSIQYTTSVLGYASSDCSNSKNKNSSFKLGLYSIFNNLFGLILGICISWFIKNYLVFLHFDTVILHVINFTILIKHSYHCIKSERMFGNQLISNSNKIIGFIMNIFDSIPFRLLLYFIFCIIF
jgi:magnesium-transporting ATPase (P-type)